MAKKKQKLRKTKYDTHVLPNMDRIPKLKRQGLRDDQIAKVLGVGVSTFKKYKSENQDLKDALKEGQEHLIEDLEHSLYMKALGKVKTKETKKYIKKDKKGREETRIEEKIKEHAPDTGALVFSLKNLAPDKWKDTHETTFADMDHAMENFTIFSKELEKTMTDEED